MSEAPRGVCARLGFFVSFGGPPPFAADARLGDGRARRGRSRLVAVLRLKRSRLDARMVVVHGLGLDGRDGESLLRGLAQVVGRFALHGRHDGRL